MIHYKNQRSKYAKHLKTNFLAVLGGEFTIFHLFHRKFQKLRNNNSLVTYFHFVIIHHEYHKNDLRVYTDPVARIVRAILLHKHVHHTLVNQNKRSFIKQRNQSFLIK